MHKRWYLKGQFFFWLSWFDM